MLRRHSLHSHLAIQCDHLFFDRRANSLRPFEAQDSGNRDGSRGLVLVLQHMTGSQSVPRSWSGGSEMNFQDSAFFPSPNRWCHRENTENQRPVIFVDQEQTSGEVHPFSFSLPENDDTITSSP